MCSTSDKFVEGINNITTLCHAYSNLLLENNKCNVLCGTSYTCSEGFPVEKNVEIFSDTRSTCLEKNYNNNSLTSLCSSSFNCDERISNKILCSIPDVLLEENFQKYINIQNTTSNSETSEETIKQNHTIINHGNDDEKNLIPKKMVCQKYDLNSRNISNTMMNIDNHEEKLVSDQNDLLNELMKNDSGGSNTSLMGNSIKN